MKRAVTGAVIRDRGTAPSSRAGGVTGAVVGSTINKQTTVVNDFQR